MTVRTLIVDDEPLAREGLRSLLADESDVEVAGECASGRAALEALEAGDVDLVLLDVQMPEMDGFEVLRALQARGRRLPAVIFVTAFDQYALDAFDVHALDYLLKPVRPERFRAALDKARRQLAGAAGGGMADRVAALLRDLEARERALDRFLVKGRGRSYFIDVAMIDWIEAAGNYAVIHAGGDEHLVRETMTDLESQLGPKGFARIHRSTIVNLDRVKEIHPWFKGDHLVILNDGTELSLTRKYRRGLEARLGKKL